MADLPPIKKLIFNQQLNGVFGEFGSGAGLQAFYLQSAITPAELDRISLISEIPGSEKWPIRNLFQREVDQNRVRYGLLHYLRDATKIRFFNPLTLTLLPMDTDGRSIINSMPRVVEKTTKEDDATWQVLEREDLFQLRWLEGHEEWAQLRWNDTRCKLVAIDGQHRLSALKQMNVDGDAGEPFEAFVQWRIPVVFVSFRVEGDRVEPPSVLEVVRNIFVYINTNAQEVNRTRTILLNDEDLNAVCTQELVQAAHDNDLRSDEDRRGGALPLLFFDWRGEERWDPRARVNRPVVSSSAVKTVGEIYDWFEYYILGTNFSPAQKGALRVEDPTHALHEVFHDERLTHEGSAVLREYFKQDHLPAVSWLLEHFSPYAAYVHRLRALEGDCLEGDNIDRHAFEWLRFGTSSAIDSSRDDVGRRLTELRHKIEEERSGSLLSPMDQDVGMRGVLWAFGDLAQEFPNRTWLEYAKWFTEGLNKAYEAGWLQLSGSRRAYLRHIVEDHNETVVNYRLEDAEKAFGPFVGMVVIAYSETWPDDLETDAVEILEEYYQALQAALVRGYKKEVRPQLLVDYPVPGRERNDAVRKQAEKLAKRQINRIRRAIERVLG